MAIVFASAQRVQETATYTSEFSVPVGMRGVKLRLNISAVTATPTLDIKVQYWDSAVADWVDLVDWEGNTVSFAQKTGTGADSLTIYPGVGQDVAATHPPAANRHFSTGCPVKLRAHATVGNAAGDKATFSLASVGLV